MKLTSFLLLLAAPAFATEWERQTARKTKNASPSNSKESGFKSSKSPSATSKSGSTKNASPKKSTKGPSIDSSSWSTKRPSSKKSTKGPSALKSSKSTSAQAASSEDMMIPDAGAVTQESGAITTSATVATPATTSITTSATAATPGGGGGGNGGGPSVPGSASSVARIVHGDCPGLCLGIDAMSKLAMVPCTLNPDAQYWRVLESGDQFKLAHVATGKCVPPPDTCDFIASQGNWDLVDCSEGAVLIHGMDPHLAPHRIVSSDCFFSGTQVALASRQCSSSTAPEGVSWSRIQDSNQNTSPQNSNFNIVFIGSFSETAIPDGPSTGGTVEAGSLPEIDSDDGGSDASKSKKKSSRSQGSPSTEEGTKEKSTEATPSGSSQGPKAEASKSTAAPQKVSIEKASGEAHKVHSAASSKPSEDSKTTPSKSTKAPPKPSIEKASGEAHKIHSGARASVVVEQGSVGGGTTTMPKKTTAELMHNKKRIRRMR